MKKYQAVILLSCLTGAAPVVAQTSGTAGQGTASPESRTIVPATPIPTAPQQLSSPSTDLCNSLCSEPAAMRNGPWQQLWFKAGYTLWQITDAPSHYPLLTTGTGAIPGVIGGADTVNLYGEKPIDFGTFQGLTFEGGFWFDQAHLNGLGFGLQTFDKRSTGAHFESNGADGILLSRPFFDVTQNLAFQNNVLQVSLDGRAGSFDVSSTAKFGGFDVYYLRNICNDCRFTLNGLVGYRFFRLTEQLSLLQRSNTLDDSNAQPLILDNNVVNSLEIQDNFRTKNQINGVEVGLKGEWNWGAFYAGGTTKVTLGSNRQTVDIDGSTTGTNDAGSITLPGGLLALQSNRMTASGANDPSNIGSYRNSQFIIMPELGVYAGFQVTPHTRVQVGYDLLYINNVTRPGLQIDPSVNQSFVPSSQFYGDSSGPTAPRVTQTKGDFFASGVNFSIEFQF